MHTLKAIPLILLRTIQGQVLTPITEPLSPGKLALDLRNGTFGPLTHKQLRPDTLVHAVAVRKVGNDGGHIYCPDWEFACRTYHN